MNLKTAGEIDAVIKIGGSAVTIKNQKETLKAEILHKVAKCIHQSISKGISCVIVHGAGSFGHHQAKEYEVNNGIHDFKDTKEFTTKMLGYSLTRQSVTKLNKIIVDALLELQVPAVSCSPGSCWETSNRQPVRWPKEAFSHLLASGLVPVLHGDCCMDEILGCCILSGDTVMKTICSSFTVKRVVFLTDVAGIYDRPPSENGAKLLRSITVKDDGNSDTEIRMSQSDVDVTGGISLKLKSAFEIVIQSKGRCPVVVCAADSPDTSTIIGSELISDNLLCTKISMTS